MDHAERLNLAWKLAWKRAMKEPDFRANRKVAREAGRKANNLWAEVREMEELLSAKRAELAFYRGQEEKYLNMVNATIDVEMSYLEV